LHAVNPFVSVRDQSISRDRVVSLRPAHDLLDA